MAGKYNNQKTIYKGKKYDSKKEAQYAAYLENEKKAGRVKKIEEQVKLYIIPPGNGRVRALCYIADFKVTFCDNSVVYYDVKGFKTEVYKLKKKLVLYFLGIEIIEV